MPEVAPSPGGALVISLDFELIWGVRDQLPSDGGAYRENLLGAREVIPRMLDLFEEFEIAATWATVGFLFARSREELEHYRPCVLPQYADHRLSPYFDAPGECEEDDPLRYAPSLIEQIRSRPRQEIGSHTYGHYYCLEPGHDLASFRADLASAVAIAEARGITLHSLVFPRNQFNPAYAEAIVEAGIRVCRVNAPGWLYREGAGSRYFRPDVRIARLVDAYIGVAGDPIVPWESISFVGDLCLLPESRFLRPHSPRLRLLESRRIDQIIAGIERAARVGGVYHLWWHPHNFGRCQDENLAGLRRILTAYRRCRDEWGMRSLTMCEAADCAAAYQAALGGEAQCA